ncbi:MAG: hypothetical protein ABFC96_15175 [Thermoguttaceae bacterium]
MSDEQGEQFGEKVPRIVRGRVDSFALYEITDSELGVLESGSPGSLHLNFAIFFASVAVSFLIALLTATVSDRVFTVFILLTIVGFAAGVFLFALWCRARHSVAHVVRAIRARIPGEPQVGEQSEAQRPTLPAWQSIPQPPSSEKIDSSA